MSERLPAYADARWAGMASACARWRADGPSAIPPTDDELLEMIRSRTGPQPIAAWRDLLARARASYASMLVILAAGPVQRPAVVEVESDDDEADDCDGDCYHCGGSGGGDAPMHCRFCRGSGRAPGYY